MTILINALLTVYILDALLMLLVILMQRPKSEGLGAAFGGGVTENLFGAQTTNVLTKATAWLAGLFFLLTFALSILYAHRSVGGSSLRRELMKNQTTNLPAAAHSPATATSMATPASTARPTETPGSPPTTGAEVGVVPPASAPLAPSATPIVGNSPGP